MDLVLVENSVFGTLPLAYIFQTNLLIFHSFIHMDDLCKGYVAIANQGRSGERYPLYGENMTVKKFVEIYANKVGVPMFDGDEIRDAKQLNRVYDDSFTRYSFGLTW